MINILSKKYTIVLFLTFIEILFIILTINSFHNKSLYLIKNNEDEPFFALYLKNEITNEYEEYTRDDFFPISGYELDDGLTNCIDSAGNHVVVPINFNDGVVTLKSSQTVFCYLYFNLENNQHEPDFKLLVDVFKENSSYIKEYFGEGYYHDETDHDNDNPFFSVPIYYWYDRNNYSNENDNDIIKRWNVVFAGLCWQMLRTTENNGVKLLYNGKPVTKEDSNGNISYDCSKIVNGINRNNNIAKSTFSNNINSLAYVGYMYNDTTNTNSIGFITPLRIGKTSTSTTNIQNIKIGTSIIDNKSNKTYTIGNVTEYDLTSLNSSIKLTSNSETKYYICNNYDSTTCNYSDARLLVDVTLSKNTISGKQFSLNIKNYGTYYSSDSIRIGTKILNNPVSFIALDWYVDYDKYDKKYLCANGNISANTQCSDFYFASKTYNTYLNYYNGKYNFSNKISYNQARNEYTLDMTDSNSTNTFDNAITVLQDISKAHYVCLDGGELINANAVSNPNKCQEIGFVYYVNSSTTVLSYVILNNGKYVSTDVNSTNNTDGYLTKFADDNNILYSMLYSENVNVNNSKVKSEIDSWYRDNLNETIYENLIDRQEIYCNDRRTNNNFGGWNLNSNNIDENLSFTNSSPNGNINCRLKTDSFSSEETTYGNGDLIYPIGLLSPSELYILTGSANDSYLRSSIASAWLSSPTYIVGINNQLYGSYLSLSGIVKNGLATNGYDDSALLSSENFVRPSIALKHDVGYKIGDGSLTNPYIIEYNN